MANHLKEMFDKYQEEHGEFSEITNQFSSSPDIHAFILLDKLCPAEGEDMISCANHDEIFLRVAPDDVAEIITEEQVRDLVRCGVMYNEDEDCFWMFA